MTTNKTKTSYLDNVGAVFLLREHGHVGENLGNNFGNVTVRVTRLTTTGVQHILHDVVAEGILHQFQSKLANASQETAARLTLNDVDAPLNNTATVTMLGHNSSFCRHFVKNEAAGFEGEVLKTLLDNVVAVGIGGQRYDAAAESIGHNIHLSISAANFEDLLYSSGAVGVERCRNEMWSDICLKILKRPTKQNTQKNTGKQ